MVLYSAVQASNAAIKSSLPRGLVAVFVGATNGIGETTLRQFAKFTDGLAPRVWFVGRSREAGERIEKECRQLNPKGSFTFLAADLSLLKEVDNVCKKIKEEVQSVNLLWLSQGTLQTGVETDEGLHLPSAVAMYGRTRFAANLLPLLQRASGLRRVVSCFTGGKEGAVDLNNLQGRGVKNLIAFRAHGSSITTLSLEQLAKEAPNVSFIHDFPGPVKSGIARGPGVMLMVVRTMGSLLGPFMYIPLEESGQRHLYLCTSAQYPAREGEKASAVALEDGVTIAKGTDGKIGSGVYTVDEKCESAGPDVDQVLAKLRQDGVPEKLLEDREQQFVRITGSKVQI